MIGPASLSPWNGGESVARRLPYSRFPMGNAELSAVGRRASQRDGAPTCSVLPKQPAVVVGFKACGSSARSLPLAASDSE
jgi:hypothetical protein